MTSTQPAIVLVTGASSGFGEAITRRFAAEGARVVVADVLDDDGTAVAAELGEQALYTHLDVRQQAAWALGLKGDHRAAEALTRAMKDRDAQVRKEATWALGMILMRDPKTAESKLDIDIK